MVIAISIPRTLVTFSNSISGNTATLAVATPTAVTGAICVVSGPSLEDSAQLANFSHVSFGITSGNAIQAPLIAPGFTGSSSTVYDANVELKQANLSAVSGLSSLGNNYNGTNGGAKNGIDEPGNDGQGSSSDTVLTAAAMGVSNPQEVGTAVLHPGMITHRHGARPITLGKRYITVSFIRSHEEP